jgi:hypothetical protein
MVFKPAIAASKTCRRLKGENQLPRIVDGTKFANDFDVITKPTKDVPWSAPSLNFQHNSPN